ncbi:hypothetical protein LX69_03179 [Breznakibacter xylanolyticus]|uniref:Uncharacterized protein n=2 Tax=Breznakibacter xylanolyticus TaxID=990 RepID=A0A2W7MT11_9BACT|nr:hypothetical protein LX69_03179 [Breznakibacter xylanolyticus]
MTEKLTVMLYVIIGLVMVLIALIVVNRRIGSWMTEKYGKTALEKVLFVRGGVCRNQVIQVIREITLQRLSDEEALDYFLKIKGLQVVGLTGPVGYWMRRYLMTGTRARLTYFEQVKFYEAFLNFVPQECHQSKTEYTSLSTFPLTEATQELIRNPSLMRTLAFTGTGD